MHNEVFVKSPGSVMSRLPEGKVRYVLAREGLYVERATSMFTTSTLLTGELPELDRHAQRCVLHTSALPAEMIALMVGFFQYASDLHGGEGALILLYHPGEDRFEWYCPHQTVKMYTWRGRWYADDSISYENPLELSPGWVQFGDAHSHLHAAIPSHIDRADERHGDGLHLIVGYINSRHPTYNAEFVVDGRRYHMPPELIFESIPEPPYPSPPGDWIARIHIVKNRPYGSGHSNYSGSSGYGGSYGGNTSSYGSGSHSYESRPTTGGSPCSPGYGSLGSYYSSAQAHPPARDAGRESAPESGTGANRSLDSGAATGATSSGGNLDPAPLEAKPPDGALPDSSRTSAPTGSAAQPGAHDASHFVPAAAAAPEGATGLAGAAGDATSKAPLGKSRDNSKTARIAKPDAQGAR
jgi:hypothetical protein